MSPEDDLQLQRVPTIDTIQSNDKLEDVKKTNGSSTSKSSPITNNKHCINLNKNEQIWTSPLIRNGSHHNNFNSHISIQAKQPIADIAASHRANNNEWSNIISASGKTEIKNGWNEMSETDNENVTHKFHDTNNSKSDTSTALHSDKLAEHDPLTGNSRREPCLDELSSCGIGSCQPKWAKMFASTHVFMVVFLLAWILQVR